MVVAFDEQDKDARLSLRQTEILQKLSNVCSDLTSGPKNAYGIFYDFFSGLLITPKIPLLSLSALYRSSTPSMVDTCSNQLPENHIMDQ
jgi:hypothetical protein